MRRSEELLGLAVGSGKSQLVARTSCDPWLYHATPSFREQRSSAALGASIGVNIEQA
jgi:hypothetical protein